MSLLGKLTNRTRSIPYVARGFQLPLLNSMSAKKSHLSAMNSVGTLFAIVNRTSETVSTTVKWRMYRKAKSGLPEDRVEVTTHPFLDLWNKPSKFFTQQELVETCQQHQELVGETEILVARDPRSPLPLELWPIRPDRIDPIASATSFLDGWEYRAPDGERIRLENNEVLQIRTPHPLDPYRGTSPVSSLVTDLDSAKYGAEWNRNFFLNSAEPGGIIETGDKRLSDSQYQEMRARWAEQHKGFANAHRVAILEHGKWVDRKYTMRDMQFTEMRNVSREIIREAFGFPRPMLGTVDDVNRANAEAAEVMYSRWLIVPRAIRWRHMLNNDLLPMFGEQNTELYEIDFDDPVPTDREAEDRELATKAKAAKELIDAGFDPLSVVEALGLPEMTVVSRPSITIDNKRTRALPRGRLHR